MIGIDLVPTGRLRRDLEDAYYRVMSGGWYIGGVEVAKFQEEWAEYCGTQYCLAVGSGFDALQILIRACTEPGDNVRVTHRTCAPTWGAILAGGAYPVPGIIPASATVLVHLYGIPAKIEGPGLLLEDAAQAHGAVLDGRRCGSLALAAAWSFYPTKNLGAYGDAGAITTDDPALFHRCQSLATFSEERAISSRMDPLQAAFLRAKLPYLDKWNALRREHAEHYFQGLDGLPDLSLPQDTVPEGAIPCWHQFAIRHPERGKLRIFLRKRGISTQIHYAQLPHQQLRIPSASLVDDLRWTRETLSLPISPDLPDEDISLVIQAIKEFCECVS